MLINTSTLSIVSEQLFRSQHKNVSFPSPLTDEILAPFGYAVLNPTSPPAYDSWTHRLTEGTPEQRDGRWYQTWVLDGVTHTPEEEAERARQHAEARIAEIKAELDRIDAQSVRPARAVYLALSKGETPDATDVERLSALEAQAVALRAELQSYAIAQS